MTSFSIRKLMFLFIFMLFQIDPEAALAQPSSAFAGSESCADCHIDEHAAWQESHHALAWRPATDEAVLGNFDEAEFTHQGITTRFF